MDKLLSDRYEITPPPVKERTMIFTPERYRMRGTNADPIAITGTTLAMVKR